MNTYYSECILQVNKLGIFVKKWNNISEINQVFPELDLKLNSSEIVNGYFWYREVINIPDDEIFKDSIYSGYKISNKGRVMFNNIIIKFDRSRIAMMKRIAFPKKEKSKIYCYSKDGEFLSAHDNLLDSASDKYASIKTIIKNCDGSIEFVKDRIYSYKPLEENKRKSKRNFEEISGFKYYPNSSFRLFTNEELLEDIEKYGW